MCPGDFVTDVMTTRTQRAGAAALALLAACTGRFDGDAQPGPDRPGGATGGGSSGSMGAGGAAGRGGAPAATTCQAMADPGPTPLFRLSTLQYRNTVRDLLAGSGVGMVTDELSEPLAAIPDDSTVGFRGMDNRVSADHVGGAFRVATAAADAITGRPERLSAFAGACALAAPLAPKCLDDFLASFGRRALRRPLTADELAGYRTLNDGQRAPAEVIRAVTVLLMTSPRFLNHLELEGTPVGGREDLLALTSYEIAARLSYTFWQSMPDEALLAAAAATGPDALTGDAGFARQLDRVFADPRTRQTIWQFWSEWLRLESFTGFATGRPAWKALAAGEALAPEAYGEMVQELRDLTEMFTWQRKSTLGELLATDLSVTRSPGLAHLYQVAPFAGSGDFPHLADRAGLLQRAALLVGTLETTNPFHRGSLVRRALLCDPLPRPDPNSLPPGSLDPPPPSAVETTRQRFARKTENALCHGCHAQFNDIGFVLESFDALGRFRTTEKVFDEKNGMLLAELPIDATATARIQLDDDRPVAGPAELNRRIAESKKVEACLAANYFRYVLRRDEGAQTSDGCVIDDLAAAFDQPGVGLDEVWKRIAKTPAFRRRKVAP
jgi:Protein of unknown function (DUF1588)/Protein of unknown function (DUF1592)/Protein of unknown function (DUF1585)/Protein of unknown function (DUF1595)